MATPTSSTFVSGPTQPSLPVEIPPTIPPPPPDHPFVDTNADFITKRLHTMLLDKCISIRRRCRNNFVLVLLTNNFLQFGVFAEAVRERLRGRLWNAKFEAWISQQLESTRAQRYFSLV